MTRYRGLGWAVALLITAGAMLWPAGLNGRPAYFYDTAGYYANGRAIAGVVEARLGLVARSPARDGAATARAAPAHSGGVVAIRAVAYAVFAYVGGWPGARMVLVILIQALLVALTLLIWWRRIAPQSDWPTAAVAGVAVAVGTSAAWFTSFVMPDIFAGLALLAFLILAYPGETPLSGRVSAYLLLLIGFAFAAHVSHVPLIAGLSVFAVGQVLWSAFRGRTWPRLTQIARLVAPVGIGVAAVLASSFIGFSEVSLAPKRLPLILARSIADGPARWYLQKHCATEKYVICDLFPVIPSRIEDVLFGPDGLRARATPDQMEAIRREEPVIVSRAARAYPLYQITRAASAFGRQLWHFDLADTDFTRQVVRAAEGSITLQSVTENVGARRVANLAAYGGVAAAIVYLLWLGLSRRLRRGEGGLLLLALAGLAGNAAVTGILSGVAHRYQARIIWVVPVVAIGFFLARRSLGRPPE